MRYSIKKLLVILSLVSVFNFHINADDSIPDNKVSELQELVVKAKRGWVEADRIVFIPTKQEKRLSNTPVDLIESMNLSMLHVKDGSVFSLNGTEVPVFINGKKADKIDIATFWSLQAKRVEYLQQPKDPNFEGVNEAVNIVVSEYSIGGVTKLSGSYMSDIDETFDIASKIAYKRMNFSAMVYDSYSDMRVKGSAGDEIYKDIYYNGKEYSSITNNLNKKEHSFNNFISASFKAEYKDDKFYNCNILSYNQEKPSVIESESSNDWTDNIFFSNQSYERTKTNSHEASLKSMFRYRFNPKFSFGGTLSYAYTFNNKNNRNITGNTPPVYNPYNENLNNLALEIRPIYKLNNKLSFTFLGTADLTWDRIKYKGSNNINVRQFAGIYNAELRTYWNLRENLEIIFVPGFYGNSFSGNSSKSYYFDPTVGLWVTWSASSKYRLSCSAKYVTSSPGISKLSDAKIRNSEILWIQGNPSLRNPSTISASISNLFILNNMFNCSLSASYRNSHNEVSFNYQAAAPEDGGLIKTFHNSKTNHNLRVIFSGSLYLFDNKLRFNLKPEWEYYIFAKRRLNDMNFYGEANYLLGNFCFGISYSTGSKWLSEDGNLINRTTDMLGCSVTYGLDNLYVGLNIRDILHKRSRHSMKFQSENYSYNLNNYDIGRMVWLSVSYVFGYGKKVNENIDLQPKEGFNSGAL